MKSVTMEWATNNINDINLIDVRTPAEFKVRHFPGTINIPMAKIIQNPELYFEKSKVYYLMCHSGGRSENACKHLETKNFKVINVTGGLSSIK